MSKSKAITVPAALGRRRCLEVALTLGAVVALGDTTQATTPGGGGAGLTDLRDPRQLSLAFRKLAWSMDDTLSFWWLRGVRYGMRGAVATPFWDMHVGLWFRTRDIGNDRYEVLRASANFYTPVGQASLLEQFANPFTGQMLPVRYATPRLTKQTYDMDGRGPTREATPGVNGTTASSIGPAWLEGDEIAIQGDVMLRNEPAAAGQRAFNVNDWSTYVGSWREVRDPAIRNPAAAQTFTDVLDFP
ncbi:MAG: hypothetical protein RLZZ473_1593, partial [Pseudomonadota bacterium]